jgi:RimJ/RimL family protein N-acetyltransferase
MIYYPEESKVPNGFSTSQYDIRPLLTSDVEKDYEAVMAAQELNLRWTEGRWPKDGFTVEENLEDLEYHQKMHEERKEFTFTVMDPEEKYCLGCIYFNPLRSEILEVVKAKGLTYASSSIVFFWLRPDLTDKQFSYRIFEKIRDWIKTEWEFNHVYYYIRGNSTAEERRIFLDAGLDEKFTSGKSVFYS